VACSLVLVGAAALLVRSYVGLSNVPLGFQPERMLEVTIDLSGTGTAPAMRADVVQEIAQRLTALPDVERAAGSVWTPLTNGGALFGVRVGPSQGPGERGVVVNFVTPGWFAACGTPLRRGRDIETLYTRAPP